MSFLVIGTREAYADPTIVTVVLTAVAGDFTPRTLLLTQNDDEVPIGRASKSVAKGILGAEDNAWFDSPVMSRDHAVLKLDPETTVSEIPAYCSDMLTQERTSLFKISDLCMAPP